MDIMKPLLYITLAAVLQHTRLLMIGGINPNIVLVLLVVLPYIMARGSGYVLAVLCSAVLNKTSPTFEITSIALMVAGLMSWYAKSLLAVTGVLRVVFGMISATIVFYIITNANFLATQRMTVIEELLYNTCLASILYYCITHFYVYEAEN